LSVIGENQKAFDEATEAIRLNPKFPVPYFQRMVLAMILNRLDVAKATYAQAQERKLYYPLFSLGMYELAFLEDDAPEMAKHAAKVTGMPGWEDQMLALEADTAAYSGRLKDARDLSRRAMDSAQRAGEKDPPVMYLVTSGLREAWFGNTNEARSNVTSALKRSSNRDVLYFAALALTYSKDDARARELAGDLNKRFPEDTIVQFNYLPTLRARLALNKGNASEAVENLRIAEPYELGVSTDCPFNWSAMYPVFVRGEAYLAARQGNQAAAEFQKILDHRGLVVNQPIAPLAYLGLARAYALQGDTAKAKAVYQDFFKLWKDADPDIPVLQQAKAGSMILK
jgi:tetratricopeptide (TPR) repeat protein